MTLQMVSSDTTPAREKEELSHYHEGQRESQGYYVLRCLVTTWEGFPTGILLDHIGAGPRFEFFVFCGVFFVFGYREFV